MDKGLDADGGGFTVVGNLLVGDTDVVQIFQGLGSFSQREAEVVMKCEAQEHDMDIMLKEFQGGSIFLVECPDPC